MSAWADLFGTPRSRRDALHTPRRHRSASPSPRVRITWRDTQPSSSPHDAATSAEPALSLDGELHDSKDPGADAGAPDLPSPTAGKENVPAAPHVGPARAARARRRARRHTPYGGGLFGPPAADATEQAADARVHRPFERTQSDPLAGRHTTPRAPRAPADQLGVVAEASSDDSFSRIMEEEFSLDAAAVEELAQREGW